MAIRPYQPSDAERLAEIFRLAVTHIGPQAYTPQQVVAWAAGAGDPQSFGRRLSQGSCLILEKATKAIAFGQFIPPDDLAMLYCHPSFARLGYATRLCEELEFIASKNRTSTLYTKASELSRPLFQKQGYKTIDQETVTLAGVAFKRSIMAKRL